MRPELIPLFGFIGAAAFGSVAYAARQLATHHEITLDKKKPYGFFEPIKVSKFVKVAQPHEIYKA